jgi:SAM-dependent methyltransferase
MRRCARSSSPTHSSAAVGEPAALSGRRDPRKATVEAGYDRIADRFLDWAREVEADPREGMLARFNAVLPDGARVLELGCGAGVPSTQQLASRFQMVGVDISATQIAMARRNVPDAEFIHADFTELSFPEASFDGVVALHAIPHVPREEHGSLFERIAGWLAPGGPFVATLGATDSPDWTGEWLGTEMFFSSYSAADNARLLAAAGLEVVTDDVVVTREPEGDVSFQWVLCRRPGGR